eukprot:scaffold1966_cov116-Skeletonema_dohrnii-CCMP3373.AAC.3
MCRTFVDAGSPHTSHRDGGGAVPNDRLSLTGVRVWYQECFRRPDVIPLYCRALLKTGNQTTGESGRTVSIVI